MNTEAELRESFSEFFTESGESSPSAETNSRSHLQPVRMEPAYKQLLRCRRVLLLQGPMGNFFNRLAKWLESKGISVCKINFNGGDWLFHRFLNTVDYSGALSLFPAFLNTFILANRIDGIVCFGDCRSYHRVAAKLAESMRLPFFVFEEGYIRPHYITFEVGGVNMFSSLPRDSEFYRSLPDIDIPQPSPTGSSFLRASLSAVAYYAFSMLLSFKFSLYRHHRDFSAAYEARVWCLSLLRKLVNRWRDRPVFNRLVSQHEDGYFICVLQVYYDSQIHQHSDYSDVREFIEEVLVSFSLYAKREALLVFKHHPMDRGNRNYRSLISSLSETLGISDRVHYVHDVHLPTLLRHSRGVITVNSTVGMSAIYHGKPVITLGRALYDLPGLTFQGPLEEFWLNQHQVDNVLWHRFRAFLIANTQLNASFHGRDFYSVMQEMEQGVENKNLHA